MTSESMDGKCSFEQAGKLGLVKCNGLVGLRDLLPENFFLPCFFNNQFPLLPNLDRTGRLFNIFNSGL